MTAIRTSFAGVALLVTVALGACTAVGSAPVASQPAGTEAIITAQSNAFDQPTLTVPASVAFDL
jgi:hypothetical protein